MSPDTEPEFETLRAVSSGPGAFSMERGPTQQAISALIRTTALSDKVVENVRPGMFGLARDVVEWLPADLPVSMWSGGEKRLWAFLASVASPSSICLYDLARRFRDTPEAGPIIHVFISAMTDI